MKNNNLRFLWIRHAPVTGQTGLLYGQADVPCSLDGQSEALERLRQSIPEDALWYCTPLSRTKITAAGIDPTVSPVEEPAFLEQNFGHWQGQSYDALWNGTDKQAYRQFWQDPARNSPPGGESYQQVRQRVAAGLSKLCASHHQGTLVVVAHAGTIRCALEEALGAEVGLGLKVNITPLSLTETTYGVDNAGQAHWLIDRVNQRA